MYKPDEPGGFIISCFSVLSAMDNIPKQPILWKVAKRAALSIPTNLGDPHQKLHDVPYHIDILLNRLGMFNLGIIRLFSPWEVILLT
jgi:hypothetical protein